MRARPACFGSYSGQLTGGLGPTESGTFKGLEILVKCLYRYVEANPERFETRERSNGTQRVVLISRPQIEEGQG